VARFSAPVQIGPETLPASCTMGTASLPGAKRPGRVVNHPPPSNAEVKERVTLNMTEVFPCFFLSCKANARIKLAKTGHGPHSSTLVVICVVLCVVCV